MLNIYFTYFNNGTWLLLAFIVFVEKAQRRLVVQYPKRQVGNKIYGGQSSHLPLKINTAGVIPVIFASSILLLPNTISGFGAGSSSDIFLIDLKLFRKRTTTLYVVFCFQ